VSRDHRKLFHVVLMLSYLINCSLARGTIDARSTNAFTDLWQKLRFPGMRFIVGPYVDLIVDKRVRAPAHAAHVGKQDRQARI
jgi:hypothetical protein